MTASDMKHRRRALELTQTDLAKRLGVHSMTVSRWERGTVPIPEPVSLLLKVWVTAEKERGKAR
jgi:DNA-binding transcriptional regulator YiaG